MNNLSVTLSQDQWNIIGVALGEMPYRQASPIINSINLQFQNQIKEKEEQSKVELE